MRRRVWRHGTVSAVGFGAMSFGGFYEPTNESDSLRTLAGALDLGVDFWDTANVYGDGLCEQVIAKFLAEDKSRRARVTLATKFAIRRHNDGARFFDNSPAHIREALDGSRKRLGVDHIDLYYVHRVDKSIPIEDTVGELARLVKAGAIGAIGLSARCRSATPGASAIQSRNGWGSRSTESFRRSRCGCGRPSGTQAAHFPRKPQTERVCPRADDASARLRRASRDSPQPIS
jgi:aryl-alcohol dehydrogenase-like predicted oxidoreductase